MVQIYGILLALVAGLVACNALTCWTCLDDGCLNSRVNITCNRTKVQESHGHISAIYGQVSTNPPAIILNYDCVEMDTLLVYRNNSERYSSYKGCLERGSSISNISFNAAIYYNETRNYFQSCRENHCNNQTVFRPSITTPSINNTTPSLNTTTPSINTTTPSINITTPSLNITTPSINITTPSLNITTPSINITTPSLNITTPSINITTPSIKTTPSTTTVAPTALKCYMCADDQCSKKTENSCSRENVDSTHKKLSDHFNQKSETKDKIESFQCMSIYSDIGDKKLLHKGCVEDGFDPCGLKDPKEKRDHCYACTKDLCNSASTLGAGLIILAVAAISLFH